MAKLHPKAADGDWELMAGDWRDGWDRQVSQLDALIEKGRQSPTLVEKVVSFPMGDGKAFYRVTSTNPLVLQWIPFGDRWHIPDAHLRGLRLEDVQAQADFDEKWRVAR